jgi:hypothetical protein
MGFCGGGERNRTADFYVANVEVEAKLLALQRSDVHSRDPSALPPRIADLGKRKVVWRKYGETRNAPQPKPGGAASPHGSRWQGHQKSNPDEECWKLLCCRYTMPQ